MGSLGASTLTIAKRDGWSIAVTCERCRLRYPLEGTFRRFPVEISVMCPKCECLLTATVLRPGNR